MAYVYLSSGSGIWTTGYYDPDGNWYAEKDCSTEDEAAKRVSFLNGNNQSIKNLEDLLGGIPRMETMLVKLLERTEPKKRKPRDSKPEKYDKKFQLIWNDYPTVAGANKSLAYTQYKKRLEEADHPLALSAHIHAAVIKYAIYCEVTERFVMLPATFFGFRKHYNDDFSIPHTKLKLPRNNADLEQFAKDNNITGNPTPYARETWVQYRKRLQDCINRDEG